MYVHRRKPTDLVRTYTTRVTNETRFSSLAHARGTPTVNSIVRTVRVKESYKYRIVVVTKHLWKTSASRQRFCFLIAAYFTVRVSCFCCTRDDFNDIILNIVKAFTIYTLERERENCVCVCRPLNVITFHVTYITIYTLSH